MSVQRRARCAKLLRGLTIAVGAFVVTGYASTASTASAAGDSIQFQLGRKLFTQGAVPACAVCHTLKDAGAAGAVGPILDELKPDANRVATALRNGVGQMPSYRASLSDAQIQALAEYVSKAANTSR